MEQFRDTSACEPLSSVENGREREQVNTNLDMVHYQQGSSLVVPELRFDNMENSETKRRNSFKRYPDEVETFEFAKYDSEYEDIKQASLQGSRSQLGKREVAAGQRGDGYILDALRCKQDYDRAEEGGFGTGMNHGVKRAGVLKSSYDKAEEGGFGTGMNHGVKRAGVFRTGCYDANEGSFGVGMNHGVKKAGILKSSYDKAEEGGFGSGRNYGVKKAGIRSNEWNEGLRLGIGDGTGIFDGVQKAEMRTSNWGRARKRCVMNKVYEMEVK